MTQQHTPGPWKVLGDGSIGVPYRKNWRPICDPIHGADWHANARLIAAAPLLLAALKGLANMACSPTDGLDSRMIVCTSDQFAGALAAIAAVEGREESDLSGVTDRQFNRSTGNSSLYG